MIRVKTGDYENHKKKSLLAGSGASNPVLDGLVALLVNRLDPVGSDHLGVAAPDDHQGWDPGDVKLLLHGLEQWIILCCAQRQHSCFPPSSPRFDSRLSLNLFC